MGPLRAARLTVAFVVGLALFCLDPGSAFSKPPKKAVLPPPEKSSLQTIGIPAELGPIPADASDKVKALMAIYRRRDDLIRRAPDVERRLISARSDYQGVAQQHQLTVATIESASTAIPALQSEREMTIGTAARAALAATIQEQIVRLEAAKERVEREARDVAAAERELAPIEEEWRRLGEGSLALREDWLRVTDPFGKWAKGEWIESLETLNEWVALDPYCNYAYISRGLALYHLERHEQALANFEKAVALDKRCPEALAARGMMLYRKGKKIPALKDFQQSLTGGKESSPLVFLCPALAFLDDGDYSKAIAKFRVSTREHKDDPAAFIYLARIYASCPLEKLRNGKEAVRFAEAALSLTTEPTWLHFDVSAMAHAEAGNFTKAIEFQNQAIPDAPDDMAILLQERLELYENHKPYREPRRGS